MSTQPPNYNGYSPQENNPPGDISKTPMYPSANSEAAGFPPSPNMPMPNAYPQPPPQYSDAAYPPGQPQQTNIPPVGGTTTYVYVNEQLQYGPSPMNCQCPHCHQSIVSNVRFNSGVMTWIVFGLCLFFGCWLGCCLFPFCMESCQDADHFCPNCNAFLGSYKRI